MPDIIHCTLTWHPRMSTPGPVPDSRVLAFSPKYPAGDAMRFRLIDGQFLKVTYEVTYWAYLDELEPRIISPKGEDTI